MSTMFTGRVLLISCQTSVAAKGDTLAAIEVLSKEPHVESIHWDPGVLRVVVLLVEHIVPDAMQKRITGALQPFFAEVVSAWEQRPAQGPAAAKPAA